MNILIEKIKLNLKRERVTFEETAWGSQSFSFPFKWLRQCLKFGDLFQVTVSVRLILTTATPRLTRWGTIAGEGKIPRLELILPIAYSSKIKFRYTRFKFLFEVRVSRFPFESDTPLSLQKLFIGKDKGVELFYYLMMEIYMYSIKNIIVILIKISVVYIYFVHSVFDSKIYL